MARWRARDSPTAVHSRAVRRLFAFTRTPAAASGQTSANTAKLRRGGGHCRATPASGQPRPGERRIADVVLTTFAGPRI